MEMESVNDSLPAVFITPPLPWLITNEMMGLVVIPIRQICISMSLFGAVTNIVNIIVFIRMGFKTSTNICFFFLAISDFISVSSICILILTVFVDWSRSFISRNGIVEGGLSQVLYSTSALGSWVTTIIAMERWCCVVFPLKVKTIFTKKTVVIMLVVVTVYQTVASVPYFWTFTLVALFVPTFNRSQLDLFRDDNHFKFKSQIRIATFSAPTIICFSLVLVVTVSLIRSLHFYKKQRESMTGGSSTTATREARIVKLVIVICTIYITGYFINVVKYFADIVYPGIHVDDPYLGNFVKMITTVSFTLQAASCSVNIFVYFKMVANYKQTLVCFGGLKLS